MDAQSQLKRSDAQHQAAKPIKIHHPEETEHHEKGASKVIKKVKEKAKKIKNALTKHGHGHGHDHDHDHIPDDHDLDEEDDEDDEDDYKDQKVHGASVYDSTAIRGGVTSQREPTPRKTQIPATEEIVPPGIKVFPVFSSSITRPLEPIRDVEPVRGANTFHGEEPPSGPLKFSGDVTGREERRGATLTPHNTPVSLLSATEDVTRTFSPDQDEPLGKRGVHIERSIEFEEDPAAPGGGSDSLGGISNYQSKVNDPTGKATGEVGAASILAALRRKQEPDEDDQQDLRTGSHGYNMKSEVHQMGKNFQPRSHGDHMKSEAHQMGKNFQPGRNHESGAEFGGRYEKEYPARSHEFDVKVESDFPRGTRALQNHISETGDDIKIQQPDQSSYTDKLADKAAAAKDTMASKLGYSEEDSRTQGQETPSSAADYGNRVVSMVSETLTPVYEKVKETGANVMNKLPISSGTETEQGMSTTSTRDYLTDKLSPGEEDKALSEVVVEKLHLGEAENTKSGAKGIVTQSEEVERRLGGFSEKRSEEERKHGEEYAAEGEGGMVEKLKGAVTSWLAGTTEEVTQKSTESVQDSTQSLGSTVGTMGFPGSGGGDEGSGKSQSVPVQRRFQDSGN